MQGRGPLGERARMVPRRDRRGRRRAGPGALLRLKQKQTNDLFSKKIFFLSFAARRCHRHRRCRLGRRRPAAATGAPAVAAAVLHSLAGGVRQAEHGPPPAAAAAASAVIPRPLHQQQPQRTGPPAACGNPSTGPRRQPPHLPWPPPPLPLPKRTGGSGSRAAQPSQRDTGHQQPPRRPRPPMPPPPPPPRPSFPSRRARCTGGSHSLTALSLAGIQAQRCTETQRHTNTQT